MIIMRNPEEAGLNLDTVDRLLTTTRAVRKRIDRERPVEPEVVEECLRLASPAPSGGNNQRWRWMVVVDADRKKVVAERYAESFARYIAPRKAQLRPDDERGRRLVESASDLVEEITYWDTWKAVR
jgi:nitroreductase